MTTHQDPSPQDWDRALARFAVISPLVCRDLAPEERDRLRKEILGATHQFPGDKRVRVSGRTLREWCQHYRQHNLAGLLPQPRKDRGKPRSIPQEVLDRAVALREELPSRSAQTISNLIAAPGVPPISASTLSYHFHQRGLDRSLPPKIKAFRRFEHPRPNSCWQSDLSDGIWLPDPTDPTKTRKCYLHGFLDDYSRLVPHAAFYWRESLPALEDCFRQAIVKFGVCRMAYWDNGSVYRSRQLRRMAARLNIEIVFSTPYSPEGKGKIERFWGTCKSSFYPEAIAARIKTLDELNAFFWAWLDRHYNRKIHSSTGQTPIDRWEAGREFVRFATPEEISDTFLWEEERVVRKTGTISLCHNDYPAPDHLIGQRVIVRFDPFDLQLIKIVHRGQVVCTSSPQELVSRTFNKAQPHTRPDPKELDSSKAYKDRLCESGSTHRVDLGHVTPMDDTGRLTAPELLAHLVALLVPTRELTPDDQTQVTAFWQRHAPLRDQTTIRAITDAIAAKDTQRPLDYYLEAIRQAHWGLRP